MTAPTFTPAKPGDLVLVVFTVATDHGHRQRERCEFGVADEVGADGRVTFVRFPDGRVEGEIGRGAEGKCVP